MLRKEADGLFKEKHHMNRNKLREMRRFVRRNSGFPKEAVIHNLILEGWDKGVVEKFVEAYKEVACQKIMF